MPRTGCGRGSIQWVDMTEEVPPAANSGGVVPRALFLQTSWSATSPAVKASAGTALQYKPHKSSDSVFW